MKRIVLAACLGISAASAASAAETYETAALAEAIDQRCGFLNIIEHSATASAASDALENSAVATRFAAGDKNAYKNFSAAIDKQADAAGCGAPARAIVQSVHALALAEIALGVANVNLRRGDQGVPGGQATLMQRQTATNLETYLRQGLGAQFAVVMASAQKTESDELEADAPDAVIAASAAMGEAYFQRLLEADGNRASVPGVPWIRVQGKGAPVYIARHDYCWVGDAKTAPSFTCHLLVRNGSVQAFFLGSNDGVHATPVPGVVRLYLRKPGTPALTAKGEPAAWGQNWRSVALAFDGKKTAETYLGAPVYDFGPGAAAAMRALTPDDHAELAIAQATNGDDGKTMLTRNLFEMGPMLREWKRTAK